MKQRDYDLHAISLLIAIALHKFDDTELDAKEDCIIAFRCIRRHITKGEDGKRYGSLKAYLAMQGVDD